MTETSVTASVSLGGTETELSARIHSREHRVVAIMVDYQSGSVLTLSGDPETLRNFGEAVAKLAQAAYEELKARPKRGGYWFADVDLETLTSRDEAYARHQDEVRP